MVILVNFNNEMNEPNTLYKRPTCISCSQTDKSISSFNIKQTNYKTTLSWGFMDLLTRVTSSQQFILHVILL